jgi:tRNA A37 threonylcarbamoyladenosine modification protein TsaB
VVVNGPWSFTGVRTTVLVANTINYIIQKNMIPLSYFDLYQNYPIIKSSSKRDCFIQFQKESAIEIMKNEEILEQLYKMNMKIIYWNATLSFFWQGGLRKGGDIKIVDKVNYESIIRNIDISKTWKCKKIDPLYIKKPNIS